MGRTNWRGIEKKWQDRWAAEGGFAASPDGRKKKFITVAYPYPNSPQHVGHGRTYTIADVHARFWRMRGYNVLFPMGFHYTGTPILGMAKRVQAKDEEILDGLRRLYSVPEKEIAKFTEPVCIADYFHEEIKSGMIEMGYSIDWSREFTTIDPGYQKFVEWQVLTLRDAGLIIQGSHPVGWCPEDENPVSQHDTLGDVEPEFSEYVLIKFACDGYLLPAATLRPETIFGVTNLWVNPEIEYLKADVDGQKWIISPGCSAKLAHLGKKVKKEGTVLGADLCGKEAAAGTGQKAAVFPAPFVRDQTGTGIVMSVPAHAPFDWQALADLAAGSGAYAQAASAIRPVKIMDTKGYGQIPAKEAVQRRGIRDQTDPKMEAATKEVYEKEHHGGVMADNAGQFAGMPAKDAKEAVSKWLVGEHDAGIMLEITNPPVRCRCGAECVVKMLEGQWFLNYADEKWKAKARKCMAGMSILPGGLEGEFDYTIGWLRQRACARQHGLGTRLPWDAGWLVESLSDSVIYMAYYAIAGLVSSGRLQAKDLTREFFDHVFLGKPASAQAEAAEEAKRQFEYFYPVDSRHSGRDLVPNHLTFFMLNHAAIFPENDWPRQIVVNGSVLMGGKKMSKSMGNIIPLRQAIQDHGADPIRAAILISAELLQDADFDLDSVSGVARKLESMLEQCGPAGSAQEQGPEDAWLRGRTGAMIASVTESIEKMRLREALHEIMYEIESDIQWHQKRAQARGAGSRSAALHELGAVRAQLLCPFVPHAAEEMWERLGREGRAAGSAWPQASSYAGDAAAAQSEDLLRSITEDVSRILRVTKISPKRAVIYAAGSQKQGAYYKILGLVAGGMTSMGQIMKELMDDPSTAWVKKSPDYVQKAIKDILSEQPGTRQARAEAPRIDEAGALSSELGGLLKSMFGVQETVVYSEDDDEMDDPKGKARHARPFKPAILVE